MHTFDITIHGIAPDPTITATVEIHAPTQGVAGAPPYSCNVPIRPLLDGVHTIHGETPLDALQNAAGFATAYLGRFTDRGATLEFMLPPTD